MIRVEKPQMQGDEYLSCQTDLDRVTGGGVLVALESRQLMLHPGSKAA